MNVAIYSKRNTLFSPRRGQNSGENFLSEAPKDLWDFILGRDSEIYLEKKRWGRMYYTHLELVSLAAILPRDQCFHKELDLYYLDLLLYLRALVGFFFSFFLSSLFSPTTENLELLKRKLIFEGFCCFLLIRVTLKEEKKKVKNYDPSNKQETFLCASDVFISTFMISVAFSHVPSCCGFISVCYFCFFFLLCSAFRGTKTHL